MILGSSNASGNGLAVEGKELTSWIEANVMSDAPQFVGKVNQWFESLWCNSQSIEVDEEMLAKAREQWKKRRALAPEEREETNLFKACRTYPELFGNVYLAIYDTKLSKNSQQKIEDIKKGNLKSKAWG